MGQVSGRRLSARGVALLALAQCALLCAALVASLPVAAAHAATPPTRPSRGVAGARIAVVRVLTYYSGTANGSPLPVTSPSPCASDGVLVGTTGPSLNPFTYVLTPTAAVNPTAPCQGAQAAFQQLYGPAATWTIGHIDVLLNAAYTGTGAAQMGMVHFSVDPAQVNTNGGPGAPPFQVLALGGTTHDLPVLMTPQPSDAPPNPADAAVLDFTGPDGQLLNRDAVTRDEVTTTLYPVATPASAVAGLGQAVGAPTPAPSGGVGGVAGAQGERPVALAQLDLGAAVIDGNGRLTGMVVPDGRGGRALAGVDAVRRAIGPVTGKPGALMAQWELGLDAYYSAPPQYVQAAATFSALSTAYPDFGGVSPFLTAATNRSDAIPPLTVSPTSPQSGPPPTSPGGLGQRALFVVAGLAAAVLLLLVVAVAVLLLRRRTAAVPATDGPPPEEAMLDLLPRDLPLDALDPSVEMEPTRPLPAVNPGIDAVATLQLPKMVPAAPIARARTGLALMPRAAGLTDAGVKRAAEPNQDNIFAAVGIRVAGGRPQPYGLFIVADGMGGHLNGREASRLTIEIVTGVVMPVLTGPAPVTDAALTGLLRDGVQRAGAELHRRNLDERLDMGTTITAALVMDDLAHVINVGDSRTYLMSPELGLRQVTVDHSVVASLVTAGVIRPEDIYSHPRRNQIYRSLGGETGQAEVDAFEVPLQAGDKLLLCSDGLWEMVRDPQIESILRGAAEPRRAVDLLVREAKANGGEDNVSAVVVRFVEDVPRDVEPGVQIVAAPEESASAASS